MKTKNIITDKVNFDDFSIQKKEITINGKKLPLNIGDKFILAENDKSIKTIVAITIFEDGRVAYAIEWYDPEANNFQTENVTLTELKLLNIASIKQIKESIGFEQ